MERLKAIDFDIFNMISLNYMLIFKTIMFTFLFQLNIDSIDKTHNSKCKYVTED